MQGFISDKVNHFWRRLFFVAVGLTAILGALYANSLDYGFYHNFVEVLGIVIAGTIFVVTWHARKIIKNNYFLFLGIAFAFVGFLNLLHVLYYPGILTSGLLPSNESNLLSLAADYFLSIAFAAAPLVLDRRMNTSYLLVVLAVATTLVLFGIFEWRIFPNTVDVGQWFTDFKNISEFTVAMFGVVAGILLYQHRRYFEHETIILLYYFLAIGLVSSFIIGIFNTPTGYGNFIGHILKIFALYFVYRAVVLMALRKPYRSLFQDLQTRDRELKEERDRVQKLFDLANVFFVYIDKTEHVQRVNRKGLEILACEESEVVGKNWFDNFIPEALRPQLKSVFHSLMTGKLENFDFYENCVLVKNGGLRDIYWRNTLIKDEEGNTVGILSAGEDITEMKNHKRRMEIINNELWTIEKKYDQP